MDTWQSVRFDIYNEDTVQLLENDDELLRRYMVNVQSDKDIDWNTKKLNEAIQQVIVSGAPITELEKSLETLFGMDKNATTRTARTAYTAAQNGGRFVAFAVYVAAGIQLRKKWIATIDMRTRHTHAVQDEEVRELDEKFSNGCRYPADPACGDPAEIYNCRCTLIADLPEMDKLERNTTYASGESRIRGMSYDEWKDWHRERMK